MTPRNVTPWTPPDLATETALRIPNEYIPDLLAWGEGDAQTGVIVLCLRERARRIIDKAILEQRRESRQRGG